jgi:Mg-chelatase subunit ChlD
MSRRAPGPRYACVILVAAALLGLAAGRSVAANIDLVVMVDTSESMFPYFDDLVNYLVQDLLTEKLHKGDTFHLLSFSSTPEVEISLDVDNEEAAQDAFGRILLLHALGRYTDLVAALQFLSNYTRELPETNPKQIILVTDGVHDPPPGSPNRGTPEQIANEVIQTTQALGGPGRTFNILRVPPEGAASEKGLTSYLPDIAKQLGVPVVPWQPSEKQTTTGRTTGFPDLVFPPDLGKVSRRFTAPFRVKNWKNEPLIVQLSGFQSDGVELLDNRVTVTVGAMAETAFDVPLHLPPSYPVGDHKAKVRLVFDGDIRISPTNGVLSFGFTGKGGFPLPRLTFLYVIYILVGLGVIYLLARLFLVMRQRLGEAPLAGLPAGRRRKGREATSSRQRSERAAAPGPGTTGRSGARKGLTPRPPASAPAVAAGGTARGAAAFDGHPDPRRKLAPLLAEAVTPAADEPVAARKRVRPTATSLRRSLPRQPLQQGSLPPLIEMRVSLQNHRIGFRNVHRIGPGTARSVGGRFSSYLIFLVPVPASMGEIRNVEGRYVFTPLRTALFPRLSGPLEDCLDTDIPFVTPRGHEMSLRFREWEAPLQEINSLMRKRRDE